MKNTKTYFFGMILLIVLVEVFSVFIVNKLNLINQEKAKVLDHVEQLILQVESYKSSTYISLVALSTSDWKRLIYSRKQTQILGKSVSKKMNELYLLVHKNHNDHNFGEEIQAQENRLGAKSRDKQEDKVHDLLLRSVDVWRKSQAEAQKILLQDRASLIGNENVILFENKIINLKRFLSFFQDILILDYNNKTISTNVLKNAIPIIVSFLVILSGWLVQKTAIGPLEKSKQQYMGVVEDQTDLIVRFDLGLNISFANTSYRLMFLENNPGTSGETFLMNPRAGEVDRFNKMMNNLNIADFVTVDVVIQVNIKGKQEWLEWKFRKIMKDQNVCEIQGVGRNITLEKLQKERIEKQKIKFQETARLSSLGEIAGGIAHEINNPLIVILNNTSLLKILLEDRDPDKQNIYQPENERIDKIMTTISRISNIITGMSNLSRDSSSEKYTTFKVRSFLDEITGLCNSRVKQSGGSITYSFSKDINRSFEICARKIQLSQVMLNLVNNAADALSSYSQKWINFSVETVGSSIEFKITDSGDGIDEVLANKIFDAFYTTKDVGEGTGLGLSIAHSMIKKMRGDIILDSTNKNTCFIVRIPLEQKLLEQAG